MIWNTVRYIRIFNDSNNVSHFEEINIPLETIDFAPPAPPLNVSAPVGASQIIFATLPAGWYGDWHPSPRKQYWIQLTGRIEVQVGDDEVRQFGAGDIVFLEDVAGKGHLTRVISQTEVQAVYAQL